MNHIIKRTLPFLVWWPRDVGTYRRDALAGLTVAMVLVPQSLAYAQLAGLPPHYGLYAALVPGVIGALWGSSSHLATGPTATGSLLTAVTLQTAFAGIGSGGYARLAIALALLTGVLQLTLGLIRWSAISRLLPMAVLKGFVNAAALVIIASQLPKLAGIASSASGQGLIADMTSLLASWRGLNIPTLGIGLLAIIILAGMRKLSPRAPAALTAAVLGGLAVFLFGFDDASGGGVAVVGSIDQTLRRPELPEFNWTETTLLLPGALTLAITGSMEVTTISQSIALKSGQRLNLDQEMIGQGLAGIAGGFFGGFPVSGSFSRTALNYAAGAKTALSSVIAGVAVLMIMLFPAHVIRHLPLTVLAGIIIMAVWNLIDLPELFSLWKSRRDDAVSAWVTLLATLYWAPHLDRGIITGILVALSLAGWQRLRTFLSCSTPVSGIQCDPALDKDMLP